MVKFLFSVHAITKAKQNNRQGRARAVDLPARSFDLARPVVAPPLLKDRKFVQCKVYFSQNVVADGSRTWNLIIQDQYYTHRLGTLSASVPVAYNNGVGRMGKVQGAPSVGAPISRQK